MKNLKDPEEILKKPSGSSGTLRILRIKVKNPCYTLQVLNLKKLRHRIHKACHKQNPEADLRYVEHLCGREKLP